MTDDEVFRFLAYGWNVRIAEEAVERDNNDLIRVPVEGFARMAGMIRVDADHAATVDLERPLLIVYLGEAGHMVIDGWHRITRASNEGVETLTAYLLTAEQERECRDPRSSHDVLDKAIAAGEEEA